MMVAAKVAFGRKYRSGVKNNVTKAITMAVNAPAAGVSAPASKFTIERENPPAIGNPPETAAPMFDAPRATLKTEMVFNDSIKVGPYREFYGREGQPDYGNPKQVKVEGQFVNGNRHGKWVTLYNTGDLADRIYFQNLTLRRLYPSGENRFYGWICSYRRLGNRIKT